MKAHLSVFALTAILVAGIGIAPVFGQSSVVITTDKESYSVDDIIMVTGEVSQGLGGYDIGLKVFAPNGNVVSIDQLTVGADKKFSTTITAGGSLMKTEGEYMITVQYGDNKNNVASTSFVFGESPPIDELRKFQVEGSDDWIGYKITGGKIVNITPELPESLIITIDATEDGSLTLTIPRTVFDSVTDDGEDEEIFVLIDGEEADEFIEKISATHRTLTIEFPAGTEQIELVGTFVVPEFGTIAAMILAIAIISIIAISAKSRLSILPRY